VRTTLTLDDDVLNAAKALAAQHERTIGDVISELARRALHQAPAPAERNGIALLPITQPAARVSLEQVNALRDELL
jgi:hypothetical protein